MSSESRLVFISAGDHHELHPTIASSAPFDVVVCFYGSAPDVRADLVARGVRVTDRQGGKFQNLLAAHRHDSSVLERYDAVFVMDDDLGLCAEQIAQLFEIRRAHDLWILQPSFDPRGRISHPFSRTRAFTRLRYTNFVENGAPLFRRDKLVEFLDVYDGSLVGWGLDYWYMHVLGEHAPGRYAVVDEVSCRNPYRRRRTNAREIDRLQPTVERRASWDRIRRKRGLTEVVPTSYGGVLRSPSGMVLGLAGTTWMNLAAWTRPDTWRDVAWRVRDRLTKGSRTRPGGADGPSLEHRDGRPPDTAQPE